MSLLRPLLAICLLLTAVAVAGEAPADLRVGEEVEVAADAAAVKVRDRVVAALKRGDRVTVERLWADRLWTTVEAGGKEVSGWVPIDQVRRVAAPALPPLELGDEVVVAAETAEVLAEGETVATLERRYMFIVEAVREGAVATTVDVAGRAVRGWVERARVRRLRPGQDLPVGKGDQVVVTADAAPVVRGDQTLTTLERRYVFTVEAVRDGKLATTVDLEGQPARGWVDAGLVRRATPRDLPQRIRLWAITERPLCTIALASVVRESLAVAPEALRVAYVERAEDGQRVVVDGRPGPVYAAIGPGMPRFGPGGEHVAYTALEEGRWRVVVDNFAGQPFDRVNALTFSPDGRRVAHAALQARKWRIVLDGQAGPAFDDVGRKALAFSADGEHLAYAAKEYDRWAVVLDGERGMAFDEVKALRFSPHGARLLYLGREGSRWHVVVDGEKGPPFATIEERTWSPNGRRYAYVGRREGRFQVVVDGRVGPPCDGVLEGTPVFSPDGRRVAYGVVRGETAQAIVDGKAGPEYDGIAGLAFSPDSRRVAYAAQKGVVWHVVVDGEEGLPYEGIARGTPVFSPDGRRVAFIGRVGDRTMAVVDGQPGPPHDGVLTRTPLFSPDGRHIAYVVVSGQAWRVVHDGEPGPPCDGIGAGTPVFSPDSRRLAYTAIQGERWRLYVNGQPESPWDELSDVTFSPDGAHLAVMARRGETWRIILDGEPGKPYGGLLKGSRILLGPAACRYLAWTLEDDALRVLRVEHTLKD